MLLARLRQELEEVTRLTTVLLRLEGHLAYAGDNDDAEILNTADEASIASLKFDGRYPRTYQLNDGIVEATINFLRRVSEEGNNIGLSFTFCNGPVEVILQAAMGLESVSSIHIGGLDKYFTRSNLEQICVAISGGMKYNRSLSRVKLEDMDLSSEEMLPLKEGLISTTNLRVLEIVNCDFTPCGMAELAAGLKENTSLRALALRGKITIGVSAIVELVEGLISHPSLKELRLHGENEGDSPTTEESEALTKLLLKALAKLLASSCELERLEYCAGYGLASHICILADGLKCHKHLKKLNLGSNFLDDDDLEHLTKSIRACLRLERLDIKDSTISDEGLAFFASQQIPGSLRFLDLMGSDQLTEKSGHSIVKILQDNPNLYVEYPDHLVLPSDECDEIEHLLDLNRSGRCLLGQGNKVPLSLWPLGLKRTNIIFRNEVDPERRRANAFFHLLQGPALMQRNTIGVPRRGKRDRENKNKNRRRKYIRAFFN